MTSRTTSRSRRPLLPAALLTSALALVGCSSSGDDAPPSGPSPIPIQSLSGRVNLPGTPPTPATNVAVSVGGVATSTDASGAFWVGFPEAFPANDLEVRIDPTGVFGNQYPELEIEFDVLEGDDAAVLPWNVVLPNLLDPAGAQASVTFNGSQGATATTILVNADEDLRTSIPAGTRAVADGALVAGVLDMSITPVGGIDLPYPLPNGLASTGFAVIGPFGVNFDPPGSPTGLDLFLPNDQGFPIGTDLFIYSYDEAVGGWVQRGLGNVQGIPGQGSATRVVATDVVRRSGLYAAGGFFNTCPTTVRGRILDAAGDPVVDASVQLDTGHAARTDSDGEFSVSGVPAFVFSNALNGQCIDRTISFRVSRAPAEGGQISAVTQIVNPALGGTTDLGDFQIGSFPAPTTGTLIGVLTGSDLEPDVAIALFGPDGAEPSLFLPADAQFFETGLTPGFYTASTTFQAGDEVFATAEVPAGSVGVLTLSPARGAGEGSVTAVVGVEDGSLASDPTDTGATPAPLAGAQVLLFGTDAISADGLLRTTDANGSVTFEGVDGPFTISAQALVGGRRLATTVVDVTPTGDLNLILDDRAALVADATVEGDVANLPAAPPFTTRVLAVARGDLAGERFSATATVDAAQTPDYTLGVPSGVELDLVLLVEDPSQIQPIVAAKQVDPAVGPLTAAQTLSVGLDASLAGGTILFDRTVDVVLTGAAATADPVVATLEIVLPGSTGFADARRLPIPIGELAAAGGQLLLPDVATLVGGGASVTLRLAQGAADPAAGDLRRASLALTANDAELALALDAPPAPTAPADGATFTATDLAAAMLAVDLDALAPGGVVPDGTVLVARFAAAGATIASGVDESLWTLVLDPASVPVGLPRLPLPMWADGSSVTLTVESLRSAAGGPGLTDLGQGTPLEFEAGTDVIRARSAQNAITVSGS